MDKVFSSTKKKKIHNIIFVSLIWSVFFVSMQSFEYCFTGAIQVIEQQNGFKIYDLLTIDYNVPILLGFIPIYLSSMVSWGIIPFLFFVLYGPKSYAKFLSLSLFVFILSATIRISFPATCADVLNYGISELSNWKETTLSSFWLKTLKDFGGYGFSCFPSNHCTDSLLLALGTIEFNFLTKETKTKNKNSLIRRIICTLLICIYALMVCSSTYILKVHYFVDWIASLGICLLIWIIFLFIKSNRIQIFFLKQIMNYAYVLGYFDMSFYYSEYITFAKTCRLIEKTQTRNKTIIIDIVIICNYILLFCPTTIGGLNQSSSITKMFTMSSSILLTILLFNIEWFGYFFYQKNAIKKMVKPNL